MLFILLQELEIASSKQQSHTARTLLASERERNATLTFFLWYLLLVILPKHKNSHVKIDCLALVNVDLFQSHLHNNAPILPDVLMFLEILTKCACPRNATLVYLSQEGGPHWRLIHDTRTTWKTSINFFAIINSRKITLLHSTAAMATYNVSTTFIVILSLYLELYPTCSLFKSAKCMWCKA